MDRMQKLHKVCWIAGIEYRKWLTLKNILILLFSILFLGEYVFSDMLRVAQMTGLQINYLEPMALVMSFEFYVLVIPLIITVVLSGFPDKSAGNIFVVVRMGRMTWLLGEILFGILAGATCLLVFFAASFVWGLGSVQYSNQWSPFMTEIYDKFPEVFAQNDRLFLESGTMAHGTPIRVTLICVGLLLLYFVMMIQVLCLFRFLGRQKTGLMINIAITVFGAVAVSFMENIKWYLPMTHAIFGEHFDKFFAEPIVPLPYSAVYFLVLNSVLLAVNMRLAKRCMIADGKW